MGSIKTTKIGNVRFRQCRFRGWSTTLDSMTGTETRPGRDMATAGPSSLMGTSTRGPMSTVTDMVLVPINSRTVHDILAHMKKIRKKETVHSITRMAQSTTASGMMTKNTVRGLIPIQTQTLTREIGRTISAMEKVSTLRAKLGPSSKELGSMAALKAPDNLSTPTIVTRATGSTATCRAQENTFLRLAAS